MMKIVFMGTADFGIPTLETLKTNGYTPVTIVTVPDKPAGRGRKMSISPVKKFALDNGIPILQPEKMKDPEFVQSLISLKPDLFVVVAFRILPANVFTIPLLGSFNLHASLLPKYRGAAPIQWAIINGETETGVTTFFLDEKVDTGKILLQERIPIGSEDTVEVIHDRLAQVGASVVLQTVKMIEDGKVETTMQDNTGATPAPKIFKEHCRIDWTKSAAEIHNLIRGLSPKPGAFTYYDTALLKIYKSKIAEDLTAKRPGEILQCDSALHISTGNGVLEVLELQQEGKKILKSAEFLRGFELKEGGRLV
jgi:methionyl-tRNA formyltransferase